MFLGARNYRCSYHAVLAFVIARSALRRSNLSSGRRRESGLLRRPRHETLKRGSSAKTANFKSVISHSLKQYRLSGANRRKSSSSQSAPRNDKGENCMITASVIPRAQEHLNIVIVGHVDHGKSTLLGRLYADTGSLPEGKLDKVRDICRRQGKEFEYAFLFDAFLEEQEQGITIDTARTFFTWEGRHYIIIDAPGHNEFLKNMVSGAARAEAALLVIDAHEDVREQSKKHGYLLSLLGIRQVAVIVNKMDLVGYRQDVYAAIETEYHAFLAQLKVTPERFVPVSAKLGDNIAKPSAHMPWYTGPTVLETLGLFRKETSRERQTLRFPVQDVYKFDARRIITGRIAAGRIKVGDRLVFSPSNKSATVKTIEP